MSKEDLSMELDKYSNTILQVCSYHRRDFDLVVIRSRPQEMQPIQASLQSAFTTTPTADLGILGRLPVELMLLTLLEFDIRSFFHFRQVNRQARIISTSLWEYNLVSKHGLEGLRGLLRAELAPYFTMCDLYRSLITDKCSACGAFGGYLFLFTAERCCFDCLQYSNRYRVIAPSAFAKLAKMSPGRLLRLSSQRLKTVPGIYNLKKTPARRPKHLLFEDKTTQKLLSVGAIGEDAARELRGRRGQENQRFMVATAYPYYSLEDARLEPGVSCKGCQAGHHRLDRSFITAEPVFTTRDFLSHFSQCVEAQKFWAASERGTRCGNDEPRITRSCGYFSQIASGGLPA
ncbi:hypothetical protein F5Y14DRAFT_287443 [Nemania sp. NC0429]|nr:hypothetical protein F5Y14DRAFT_287443 [Nemania sp. NC0429]